MGTELIRTLYLYNAWANQRTLIAAARLTHDQFVTKPNNRDASLRDTLVHIISAQQTWLARCQGMATPPALQPDDFPNLAAVRTYWAEIERLTRSFINAVSDAGLARVVSYVNDQGETWSYPIWQMLIHQANHAAQHRSEAAVTLTHLGCSPGQLDFLRYVDQQNATKQN